MMMAPRVPRRWRAADVSASSSVNGSDATSQSMDDTDDDNDDDDSGGGIEGATFVAAQLKRDGDSVLIRRKKKFWVADKTQRICKNAPMVLSREGASNDNCIEPFNSMGLSCTCLEDFDEESAVWEFKVVNNSRPSGTPPEKVERLSTLEITAIAPFVLEQAVTTVKISGRGPNPEKIQFMQDVDKNGVASDPKLEASKDSEATLTTVIFENLDVSSFISTTGFFKPSITNLTLRNCNLRDESTEFLTSLPNLQYLNLEKNKLSKIPREVWLMKSINQVYLQQNSISNVVLDESQYQTINASEVVFSLDQSAATSANCSGGAVLSAQGLSFCVLQEAKPDTEEQQISEGSNTSLLIAVIAGSVIIVLLGFFVIRKRASDRKNHPVFFHHSTTENSAVEGHFERQPSDHSVSSTLLNDPIIITHRLPYNDVKVATCISRGGFGLVYSGTFNRRRVAIKKIRPELSGEIKHIESFLKEICLMASLSHPRIVEFVGVSWDSLRNLSAVTEFMERGDLRDVLHSAKERNVRLSWESHKARIAMHVAEALTYLHSLSPKVIHRDLKSKNVLLDNEMTAKLSDFGVSRERRFEESHMTAGIGTAFWIAPEVLLGMDYDERADIFSFGVVLSELDTDDYPYWNEKNGSEERGKQQENVILRMVATGALRPEFSASCPESVLRLAGACLDVDPEKRPSAAQIVYALQQLIKASPITPLSPSTSTMSV